MHHNDPPGKCLQWQTWKNEDIGYYWSMLV
jgi:hypothetical protein